MFVDQQGVFPEENYGYVATSGFGSDNPVV